MVDADTSGTGTQQGADARYTLGVGEAGKVRLGVINELYNPSTQAMLAQLDDGTARNILEVACGNGQISSWMARRVGDRGGRVVGVDNSPAQLTIAREAAKRAGVDNAEYSEVSIFDVATLRRRFNLVYSRFILVHVSGAEAAVRSMRDVLEPGGVLLCEEATASSCVSSPPAACIDRWLELWRHLRNVTHAILDLGGLLPDMFRKAGLVEVSETTAQPKLDTPSKRSIFRLNVIETKAAAVATGFATPSEIDRLADDLLAWEQSSAEAWYMKIHQVVGRAPRS